MALLAGDGRDLQVGRRGLSGSGRAGGSDLAHGRQMAGQPAAALRKGLRLALHFPDLFERTAAQQVVMDGKGDLAADPHG